MFPIEPIQDIVVVKQATEETTVLGIILPTDASKLRYGEVMAVGPGKYDDVGTLRVPEVSVGDFVYFGKHQSGGEAIEIEGQVYLLFRVGDLVGKRR